MNNYIYDILIILASIQTTTVTCIQGQEDDRNTRRQPVEAQTIDIVLKNNNLHEVRVVHRSENRNNKVNTNLRTSNCEVGRDCLITRTQNDNNQEDKLENSDDYFVKEALEDWKRYIDVQCKGSKCDAASEERDIQEILRDGGEDDDTLDTENDVYDKNVRGSLDIHMFDLVRRIDTLKKVLGEKLLQYIQDPHAMSISHFQLSEDMNYKFVALKLWYHHGPKKMRLDEVRSFINHNLEDLFRVKVMPHDLDDNVVLVSPKLFADLEKQSWEPRLRSQLPMTRKQQRLRQIYYNNHI